MVPPVSPVMTATVIAALGFTGRDAGQAQGADGRCHQRCDTEAGSPTPGH
jgi:hypothetical protein